MGSFSTPLSGLSAAQDQLQSVTNNLANIDTDGYKDQSLTFSDIYAQTGVTNGAGNPIQTGSGVTVASTNSKFTEGTLNPTGNASNMAISGNGFFVVQSGTGGTLATQPTLKGTQEFTRAGDFTTNSAGYLVTPSGQFVLGYAATGGGALEALNLNVPNPNPPVGTTTDAVSTYSVGADGTITATYQSGETGVLGQVAVASFANVQGLVSVGNNCYQQTIQGSGPALGTAATYLAETNGSGAVVGGSVEGSNVDIATEFSKLIVAQQAYSANAKSITALNSVSQATLAMIQ
jgi:flagellar hook protein FlgE